MGIFSAARARSRSIKSPRFHLIRHPRESGDPDLPRSWIPAFAGMTAGKFAARPSPLGLLADDPASVAAGPAAIAAAGLEGPAADRLEACQRADVLIAIGVGLEDAAL